MMGIQRVMRSIMRFIGAAAASMVLGIAVLAVALMLANRPAEGIGPGALFAIEKGQNAQDIAKALEDRRLIRSALAFRVLSRIEGAENALKAGTYRIEPGMETRRILDEFVSGKQALTKITIPEGYTLGQIARLLEREGVSTRPDFMRAATSPALLSELSVPADSAEGYLYPDTYYFPVNCEPEILVRSMVGTFRERIASIPESSSLSPSQLHEKLILASIVEREYKSPDEAPVMASVFYNRLKIKMALQSCATVVYVITEHLGKKHPDIIYDRDLKLDDPYNTYKHRDLPPGPISSPGLTALRAVFHPSQTKYLYFRLVDEDAGRHHFSETLEEHIDSRTLYVKRLGN
jgi:UPF0755 protein